ncbi:MAG: glutathione S-transferase family protein [Alphaproteobacteria bacterium]|nr:glutathione S-transferase family protein [Alphaproteobacteria bacterium]
MTKPVLVYLKMRALAEAPQMLMHHAGMAYSYKMAWDHFGKPWPDSKREVPFRQLPMLVVEGGRQIAQSGSIMRYLANHLGMIPADPVAAAWADSIFEATQELFMPLNPTINFAVGDDFETKRTSILSALPPRLDDFERILDRDGGGFLAGNMPHYCDFGLFHHLDLAHFLDDDLLTDFPQLAAFMQNMRGIDGMADYLQSRPELTGVGEKPQLVIDGRPVPTGMKAD